MLGALLASLPFINATYFEDAETTETNDRHWASDNHRFDDWLLHGDADDAEAPDMDMYY